MQIKATEEEFAVFILLLHKARKVIKRQKRELLPIYNSVMDKVQKSVQSLQLDLEEQEQQFAADMIDSFLSQSQQHENEIFFKRLRSFRNRFGMVSQAI